MSDCAESQVLGVGRWEIPEEASPICTMGGAVAAVLHFASVEHSELRPVRATRERGWPSVAHKRQVPTVPSQVPVTHRMDAEH